jgi:hypothetical protein
MRGPIRVLMLGPMPLMTSCTLLRPAPMTVQQHADGSVTNVTTTSPGVHPYQDSTTVAQSREVLDVMPIRVDHRMTQARTYRC